MNKHYEISTFGQAHNAYTAMNNCADDTPTLSELLNHWNSLRPLLSKLFCECKDSEAVLTSEHYTGMQDAASMGLPKYMHETWQRMRVLQGLTMHLQLWVFFGCIHLNNHRGEFAAEHYGYQARELINAISDVLEDSDSLPEGTEDWVIDVMNECATEASTENTTARDAARYRYLRERDLETINQGGVFAGMTPENVVLNGEDLDQACDAGLADRHHEHAAEFRAAQQGVQRGYVLEDDGHAGYLDGQVSRFSLRRADGEFLAWIVAAQHADDGEAIAREILNALNATTTAQQGVQDAEPAAWVATFKPEGLLALHSVVGANLEELKQSVPGNSVFRPLYTHPTTQGVEKDVRAMVDLLNNREWAEHIGETALGRELEHAITSLYNHANPTTQGLDALRAIKSAADKLDAAKRCELTEADALVDEALEILDAALEAQAKEHTA